MVLASVQFAEVLHLKQSPESHPECIYRTRSLKCVKISSDDVNEQRSSFIADLVRVGKKKTLSRAAPSGASLDLSLRGRGEGLESVLFILNHSLSF